MVQVPSEMDLKSNEGIFQPIEADNNSFMSKDLDFIILGTLERFFWWLKQHNPVEM